MVTGILFIKDFNSWVKKFGVPLGKKIAYLRNFHVCKLKKFSKFFFLKTFLDILGTFGDSLKKIKKNFRKKNFNFDVYF